MDPTEAKQFLISRVIEEAEIEQVNLSEVERKMLRFTEAEPATQDMAETVAEFEESCDSDEFESKVIALLKSARARDAAQSHQQEQMWSDSIWAIKQEDHYILVMIYRAFPEYRKSILPTHRVRDYMIYIAIGIAVVLVIIGIAIWSH